MKRFAEFIADNAKKIFIIALLLLIPAVVGYLKTGINYDILSYLPQNLDSTKGEKILDDVYSDASIGIVIVDGMEQKDITKVKAKINQIDGVIGAYGADDVLDASIPKDILPDDIQNQLYSGDSTMFIIKFEGAMASQSTMDAIEETRNVMDDQCYLSGMSAILKDTKDLADKEAPFYVIMAVIISLVMLFILLESTVVPIIFMLSIGIGIIYNLGTNIIFGEISYITKALAAVLQLGVTMDYSIFLMHRYDEELEVQKTKERAMASAIQATILSISASSLTTIAGFAALCAMDLTLGKDIGLVMAKGVILGVICSVTVLPAFILIFDKPIHKFKHRNLIPEFNKLAYVVTNHSKTIITLFILILIPFAWAQNNTSVYYNLDESLPKDMKSIVALNKMKDEFNMMTSHFIIVDDKLDSYQIKQMGEEMKKVDGITTIISYNDFIGPMIPEDFVPEEIREIFKQGGYNLILANSSYKSAQDEENEQIDKLIKIVKKYDKNAMISGEGPLTKDLIDISNVDFKNVSIVSIFAIFLIILVVFKSISIPIILVSAIEFAIFVNMGIPYFTGSTIPFIASIVIGTIQLGATVDYAILLTSRFQEELKKGIDKKEAMRLAVQGSAKSIVTSGLTFFGATGGVAIVSDMSLIRSLCFLISRGAIISMIAILLILPSLLLVFEGVINKTSIGWRKNNGKQTKEVIE